MGTASVVVVVIYIMALICFFLAILDYPPGTHPRLIAAGLFLWLLATLITRV